MKYLILLVVALSLISCEEGDDTKLIKGDYTLVSYEKINCDGKVSDLTWTGAKSAGDEINISGSLDISFFGIFKQKLVIQSNVIDFEIEIEFIGAFSHISGDEWRAGFTDSPFEEGDCEEADIIVEGDTLRWYFVDGEGCEIVMIWNKD